MPVGPGGRVGAPNLSPLRALLLPVRVGNRGKSMPALQETIPQVIPLSPSITSMFHHLRNHFALRFVYVPIEAKVDGRLSGDG